MRGVSTEVGNIPTRSAALSSARVSAGVRVSLVSGFDSVLPKDVGDGAAQ
jgi:hypothetical protein